MHRYVDADCGNDYVRIIQLTTALYDMMVTYLMIILDYHVVYDDGGWMKAIRCYIHASYLDLFIN